MQQIPMQPTPAQTVKSLLNDQNCQIYLYQKQRGLFVDISVDGVAIVTGVIARDAVPIICREYVGFSGNLIFIDTQGKSDPSYEGLGSRFALVYLTESENALI